MKKYILLITVVFLSLCLCSCTQNPEGTAQESSSATDTYSNSDSQSEDTDQNAETDFKITILSTEAAVFADDYVANQGEKYFFVAVEAENISDKEQEISWRDFSFFVNEEEAEQTSFSSYSYEGLDSLRFGQKIPSGRKANFYLAAVLPEESESVLIVYQNQEEFDISLPPIEKQSGSDTLQVGNTLNNLGFEITLLKAVQTDYIPYLSTRYYSPDEGKHFVVFFFDVKNSSGKTMRFNYLLHFDPYVDNYAYKFTSFFADIDGYEGLGDLDYTDIPVDKSIAGYCALEILDGWSTIELAARNGTFIITPEQVEIQ